MKEIVAAYASPVVVSATTNGNSNLPGSSPQILHCDGPWHVRSAEQAAERGEEWPPKPASVSVTFSPSEMSPANGSTEGTRPTPPSPLRGFAE